MADLTSTQSQRPGLGALVQFSDELTALVERVSGSTVAINGRPHRPGTATVVAADLVVTADHTLERDDDLQVQTNDGRTLSATIVGRDPASDLALLRVADLGGVVLAPASSDVKVGALALAVTRTWQARPAARLGIVSGVSGTVRLGRGTRVDNVIVPDIGITRGLSGSPLVNANGELLGIVTTGLLRGFPIAIPHATVGQVVATLREHGRVKRGYLGVALQTVRLNERQRAGRDQTRGALIVGLSAGGPADKAGLLVGDIIVSAGGAVVSDIDDVQAALEGVSPGAQKTLELIRGSSLTTVDVVVGEPPQ